MNLFNIFKKGNKSNASATDKGASGPAYLDGLVAPIDKPEGLKPHEWRRQLKTPSGQTKFTIRFYGQYHQRYSHLVTGTRTAPPLIIAIDPVTEQEIILFDGCKHGYNAMFCDTYTEEQINNRPTENLYKDKYGCSEFSIIISTFNSIDYDREFADQVNKQGLIQLVNGAFIEFETAKRNGFDTLVIWVINNEGKTVEILSEELA